MACQIPSSNACDMAGPYRATYLWNAVIDAFELSMPVGRRRHLLRSYDNCFVATDAVTWLHRYLQKHPAFGLTVSRVQAVRLLQKFHKSGLFEDVRGVKYDIEELTDSNGRLFRFCKPVPAVDKKAVGQSTISKTVKPQDKTLPARVDVRCSGSPSNDAENKHSNLKHRKTNGVRKGILKHSNSAFTNECADKSSKQCQGKEVCIFERSDGATKNKLQKPTDSGTAVKQVDETISLLKQPNVPNHSSNAVKLTLLGNTKAPPSAAKKVTISSPSLGSDIDTSSNKSIVSLEEVENIHIISSPKSHSSMFSKRHQLLQKDNQPLKHCSDSISVTTGSCCAFQLTDAESSQVYANKFYDSLRQLLQVNRLDHDVTDATQSEDVTNLVHNMTFIANNGIVSSVGTVGRNGSDTADENEGHARDLYTTVCDYFIHHVTPLFPQHLCTMLFNILEISLKTLTISSYGDIFTDTDDCSLPVKQVHCMETSFGLESTTPRTYIRKADEIDDDPQQKSDVFQRCISVTDLKSINNLAVNTSEWCSNKRLLSRSCCHLVKDEGPRNVCLAYPKFDGLGSTDLKRGQGHESMSLTCHMTFHNPGQVLSSHSVNCGVKTGLNEYIRFSRSCCRLADDNVSKSCCLDDDFSELVEMHPHPAESGCCFTQRLSQFNRQGESNSSQSDVKYGIQPSAGQPRRCQQLYRENMRRLSKSCGQLVIDQQLAENTCLSAETQTTASQIDEDGDHDSRQAIHQCDVSLLKNHESGRSTSVFDVNLHQDHSSRAAHVISRSQTVCVGNSRNSFVRSVWPRSQRHGFSDSNKTHDYSRSRSSYRRAVDINSSFSTPVGKSLYSRLPKMEPINESQHNFLKNTDIQRHLVSALQHLCLLLPPVQRRKLQLLLRYLSKISKNADLSLHHQMSNRKLVINTFSRYILCGRHHQTDQVVSINAIVGFMIDFHSEITRIPHQLQADINSSLTSLSEATTQQVVGKNELKKSSEHKNKTATTASRSKLPRQRSRTATLLLRPIERLKGIRF